MLALRLPGLAACTLLTLSLLACGGDGSAAPPAASASYKVSGTAAYGLPVAAQTVQALDSAGKVCATATTAGDGSYVMDTTTCAQGSAAVYLAGYTTPAGAPLEAVAVPPQGSPVIQGVVNVNPLTTLLAYAAAGLVPRTSAPHDNAQVLALLPKVTAEQYLQARTAVLIAPLLQVLQATYGIATTGFDPTTTPFAANGQGIDAFFDDYPLTATPTSVQLTAPGSIGPLVQVTLPATAGSESTVNSTTAYNIGGSVSGLASGSLTLLLNGAHAFTITADGRFTFPTPVSSTYAVTVAAQPAGKTCTVSNGSGTGVTASVSNIAVTCAVLTYPVGGTVAGLTGGAQVTLRNNGADPATVSANGAFSFATPIAYGGSSAVTVDSQPAGQTCTVSNGSHANVTASVSNVGVTCSVNTYTIGGTLSGLAASTQVTLRNNGADPVTVTANGAFAFATPVAWHGAYVVTVGTQPVGQTCTVTSGSGSNIVANIGSVVVACAATPRPAFVYVPDYGGGRVLGYRVDTVTGAFSSIPGSPFAAGIDDRWVETHPAGTFAYATNQASNNISAYSLNPSTGALTAVAGSPFAAGSQPASITLNPAGTFAYAANAQSGNVSGYSIDPATGALSEIPGSPFAAGTIPIRIAIHPAGTFAYVANQNGNDISAYSIDATSGALTPVPGSPFATAGQPYSVTVNPAGTFAYAANYQGSISGFSIDATTGALTPISGSPFTASFTGSGWAAVVVNPAGTFAYASTGENGRVEVFSIDAATGALTHVPGNTFGSTGALYVRFDATGSLAYVGNFITMKLSVVNANPLTGALTNIPGSPYNIGARPYNLGVFQP